MVLTDTPLAGAMVTAERVTVSIGVAEHLRRTDSGATRKRANESLYRAKEGGRNRCEAALLADSLHKTD